MGIEQDIPRFSSAIVLLTPSHPLLRRSSLCCLSRWKTGIWSCLAIKPSYAPSLIQFEYHIHSKNTFYPLKAGLVNGGSNRDKSVHATFMLGKATWPAFYLHQLQLPISMQVWYVELNLDRRLNWSSHKRLKRTDKKRRYKLLIRQLDMSKLSD